MIFPILPIFLRHVLGASFGMIGVIEGVAEGLGSLLKYVSGYISDKIHRRKGLTLIGYGVSALSKLFFALATSPITVLLFRMLDRTGKGIRTSPRDALIADSVAPSERGKYFGIHRAADTFGAVLGTIIAVGLLWRFGANLTGAMRAVLFWSFVPAAIGVALLFFVRETGLPHPASGRRAPLFHFGHLSTQFRWLLIVAGLFGLANYSYSFYILKADMLDISIAFIPIIYLLYNIFYAASSYPAGRLSDRIGRTPVLIVAFGLFAIINIAFAYWMQASSLWILFILYGLFVGLTDGVFKAFVSDLAAKENRGEAFGLYHTVIGFSTLIGNTAAGIAWQRYGAPVPFVMSALLIMCAAVLIMVKFYGHESIKITNGAQDFKGYRR